MSDPRLPFQPNAFEQLAKAEPHHWWFRSRNKLLLWALKSKVGSFASLLEIGCGTGYVLEGISKAFPAAELHAAEYFEEGLVFARQRVGKASFRVLDATNMNDKDCYDVIGAFDVIEHIEQDEKVLMNLANALTSQGSLIVTVPQHQWLWSQVDEQVCHVRRYSRRQLIEKIQRTGLTIHYVTSFVSFLVPIMWIVRKKPRSGSYDAMGEFQIPRFFNFFLEWIMQTELLLTKLGVRFPVGGSLLVIAKK
jgi:SAM-dependent methyltransferase